MKSKIKLIAINAITMISLLSFNICVLSADGIEGVSVSGNSITVDVGKAGKTSNAVKSIPDFWNKIFDVGRYVVSGVTGILCIAMVGVFAVKSFQLATAGGNPKVKQEAITGMMYAAIGAGLLGSATLLSGLAFGLFKI